MKNSRLNWHKRNIPDAEALNLISSLIPQLHEVIAKLLIQRGQKTYQEVEGFFNPSINDIESFGVMKGLQEAAEIILSAIKGNEKILLYGDYDVDGTCAVSIMFRALSHFGANVSYYIPDRYSEGYGVSSQGVAYALENQFDLFITLDCGISAVGHLNSLSSAGLNVIVCDHHLPGETLPDVAAILNPKQEDCTFLGKELCGSGVALMLLKQVSGLLGEPDYWKKYLGIAAVATCCDIVPLTGINRIIVNAGINVLNQERGAGLGALLDVAGFKEELEVSDIVFKIGPRINAAGRLEHAKLAVELLNSEDPEEALELSRELDALNSRRKTLDRQATIEASLQMREFDPNFEDAGTVVFHENWDKGIIGIVASRLIEECYRPTIVFSENAGELTGSARSIDGFNLHEAISECDAYLERFGGHAAAAGLTIRKENFEAFKAAFNSVVREKRREHSTKPSINIDLELDFADWYNDKFKSFWAQFNRLRPFGPANLPPVFATRNCKAKFPQVVGDSHLKFQVFQEGDSRRTIPVIAFGQSEHYESLLAGRSFDLAYSISSNKWNGKTSLQLDAKDLAFY
jgi:single-stranded-DNA-specific exonuclease